MAKRRIISPGITMREDISDGNVYRGDADALVAAGLVKPDQFPGQPANGKTRTSFRPDGTKVKQGTNDACKMPGYFVVRKSGNKFEVAIRQSDEEMERRHERWRAEWLRERQRETAIHNARPSPPRRGHLRLVWSA